MSLPREGSREINEGIIVSEAMDWCNSPLEPVGYRIWARQVDATNLADSVRQTNDRSHVRNSLVLRCYGDEPGVGGGVTSGTTGAECTPKTWSESVFAQNRNMVRHDDEWWMNHYNTFGRLTFVKDQNAYSDVIKRQITPDMQLAQASTVEMNDANPIKIGTGTKTAQVELAPYLDTFGKGGSLDDIPGTRIAPRGPLRGIPRLDPDADPAVKPNSPSNPPPSFQGPRISDNCKRQIGRYGMTCTERDADGNRFQAHHVPPDYTMGTVRTDRQFNRPESRFPNMPNFRDMPAICLQGSEGTKGTEHNQIQTRTNDALKELGKNSGGMARLGDVINESIDVTVADPRVGEACRKKLEQAAAKAFKDSDSDQLVRTDPAKPSTQQDTIDKLMKNPPPRYLPPYHPGDII